MNPFPGLRPFQMNEAEIFFGRGQQIEQMLFKLETRRFLAVVGASGCGKSSLVRAGLLPALRDGFLTGVEGDWRFVIMRPGDAPFVRLAEALHDAVQPSTVPKSHGAAGTQATLNFNDQGLVDALDHLGIPSGDPVLVLVDQFEEIFRFRRSLGQREAAGSKAVYDERDAATAFVNQLLAASRQSRRTVCVVLTMRSDFLGDCDAVFGLPEAINDSQFLVPRLSRERVGDAIVGPLKVVGAEIDDDLVMRLKNDTGSDPDQLPLLQHTLLRLWLAARVENPARPRLTLRQYLDPKIGGLEKALSNHADEAFASLSASEKIVAEKMFRSLCELDAEGKWTRRWVKVRQIAEVAGVDAAQVKPVVAAFVNDNRNFLFTSPDGELEPTSTVDVSHESLLRRWGRLKDWIDAESKSAGIYRRLAANAALWNNGERDLLGKIEVAYNHDWRKNEKPTRAWAERYGGDFDLAMRFFEKSEKAVADQAAKDEDARKVKLQARYMRRLVRYGCIALGALLLLGMVAIWQANVATSEAAAAKKSAEEAEKNAVRAKKFAEIADQKTALAIKEKESADKSARAANQLYLQKTFDESYLKYPLRSTLLAVMADRYASETGSAVDYRDLRKSLSSFAGVGYFAGPSPISHVTASQDADSKLNWIAAANNDGKIVLWERTSDAVNEPNRALVLDFGYEFPIHQLQFLRNGTRLAARTGAKKTITLWKTGDFNKPFQLIEGYENMFWTLHPDWLLTSSSNWENHTKGKLIHLESGREIELEFDAAARNLTWASITSNADDDGRWFAMMSTAGDAYLCDLHKVVSEPGKSDKLAVKKLLAKASAPELKGAVIQGNFSRDGKQLNVFFENGWVRSWNRYAEGWDIGVDAALPTTFPIAEAKLKTDADGYYCVVARRSIPSTTAAPQPPAPATSVAGGESAFFFRAGEFDAQKAIALGNFEPAANDAATRQRILVDDKEQWLVALTSRLDYNLRIWRLNPKPVKGNIVPTSLFTQEAVGAVQLSADGRWLVAKSKSQAANWLRVWDLWAQDVGQSPYILRGHDAGVTAFTLTSRIEGTGKEKGERSSWLVSAGFDGSVRAWDLTRLSSSAEPIALQSPARGPGFGIIETSPALRWLAISTATGATELWNLEKPPLAKKPPIVLPAGKERFPTLLASRDKRWLLALASDNKGHVWDLMSIDAKNAARPHCVLDLDGAVADFFVSNDATWISAAVRKGNSLAVQLWKLKTAADQAPSARTAEPAPLSIAALRRVWGFVELEKGVGLLTETPSKMSYWNLSEDKIAEESMPFLSVNHVPDITLSPNGRTILAAPAPASKSDIYAIKLDGSGAPFKPRGPFRNFELLYKWDGLALNNSRLVAWENGKRFMAWSLDDPTQMPVVADTKGAQIDSLSFDFRWAVARMGQSKRELWDLQSNSPFQGVPLEEGIGSCIFSVDSKWLITAGNQFLKVRQLTGSKREPVAEFAIPREGENNQALIEPQGFDMRWATVTGIKERVLLALGQDLTIRVWDSAVGAAQTPTTLFRGQLIVDPMGGNGHAFVVPDGKRLFLLDARRNVLQISRIDADDLIAKAERTVGRNLSPAEWKDLKIPQKYEKIFPNLKEIDADMGPSPLGKLKAPGKVTAKPLDDRPNLSRGEIILDAAGELTGAEPIRPYAIRLETERWYQFDMTSTQVDSLLTLEDPDGKLVIQDDDGGGYPDARIIFKCPKEGTYKIVASGFAGGLGKYSLVVRASEHFQAPQRPITDLILSDGKVTRTGSLTPDDVEDQTFRGCPSKIFSVKIDGGKICQIDLKSSDFVPGLRLEDAKGTPLAFGGDGSKLNARIVVPITTGADYRIVVISRSQASGGFELSIRTR